MSDAIGWRTAWMTLERVARGDIPEQHVLLGLISEFKSRERGAEVGFTPQDVRVLRGDEYHPDGSELWVALDELADRIERKL